MADLVSSESSLLGLQVATFLLCLQGVFPLCSCIPDVSLYVGISSSNKDTGQIGLSFTQRSHFNLVTSLKALSPNIVIF